MSYRLSLFVFYFIFITSQVFTAPLSFADDKSQEILGFFGEQLVEEMEQSGKTPAEMFKPKNEYLEIPTAYIDEAIAYGEKCAANPQMTQYYNCECMAVRYLDERVEVGPDTNESLIALKIDNQCRDGTQAAGVMYSKCLRGGLRPPEGMDLDKFCSCVGNTYAKLYENGRSSMSSGLYIAMRSRSITACQNPDLSRRVYSLSPSYVDE